jgi:predicted nucleic acid-binding protein
MVAVVSSWHEHHERAIREIQNRLNSRQRMVVAAPALIEMYSVLTRFPAPHRFAPSDALNLIEQNFLRDHQIVALSAAACRTLLRTAPDSGISGGRVYDAVIATCAVKARVNALLTFNEAHFSSLAIPGLRKLSCRRLLQNVHAAGFNAVVSSSGRW